MSLMDERSVVRLDGMMLRRMVMEELSRYRSYGNGRFDVSRFDRPVNDAVPGFARNKPKGGLWATPVGEGNFGWLEWNERECYLAYDDGDYFEFTLKPGARVYVIASAEDAARLPQQWDNPGLLRRVGSKTYDAARLYGSGYYPDFERISEDWDATEFRVGGEGVYDALYGWDCDSLLVLNPDVVEVVRQNPNAEKTDRKKLKDNARQRYKDGWFPGEDMEWDGVE